MAENENQKDVTETSDNIEETKKSERPARAGSTRLPPFPMVHIVKPKVARKTQKITFDKVPELRKEMKSRLFEIDRREKFDHDFKRTSQDFWRMELDRLSRIGDDNRRHMTAAIKVYLGQTRGSSKAVQSLLKHVRQRPQAS